MSEEYKGTWYLKDATVLYLAKQGEYVARLFFAHTQCQRAQVRLENRFNSEQLANEWLEMMRAKHLEESLLFHPVV